VRLPVALFAVSSIAKEPGVDGGDVGFLALFLGLFFMERKIVDVGATVVGTLGEVFGAVDAGLL